MRRLKLILHVGVHRTGTSAVQRALARSEKSLERQGYLVPFGKGRHDSELAALMSGEKRADEFRSDLLEQQSGTTHTILMSDEDIVSQQDLSTFRSLGDHFDMSIVTCIREQSSWLESWYRQNVKWQWQSDLCRLSWAEFFSLRQRFHWIDYECLLNRLALVGSVRVYRFEDVLRFGAVEAFARAAGLVLEPEKSDSRHLNQSLSCQMTEFLRHLPLDAAAPSYRAKLERAATRLDASSASSAHRQSFMSEAQRTLVREEFSMSNQIVAENYFGTNVLFPTPERSPDLYSPPANPNDVIAAHAAPFLRQLIEVEGQSVHGR